MDIARKLELAFASLDSIGTHDDADSVEVATALNQLERRIGALRDRLNTRSAAKVEAIVNPPVKPPEPAPVQAAGQKVMSRAPAPAAKKVPARKVAKITRKR